VFLQSGDILSELDLSPPYKEDYNYYDESKEQFIIPLNPENGEINLNTDAFVVINK
jgi:hypothetical protein